MKTPKFWYCPAWRGPAALLEPFGQIYRVAGKIHSVTTSPYKASVPVICVGNVTAGGAGKTPTALALARLLKQEGANSAFVMRGYGGREEGPLRVDPLRHSFRDVGDEALLLARAAPCWIGRDRAEAVRAAEPHASHIILDDGLQNPSVVKTTSLLAIDGPVGLGNGRLIPAGPLRETLGDALDRVNAVVMIGEDRHELIPRFAKPVLQAKLCPIIPDDFPKARPFLAFAGIGRPEKFYATCRQAGLMLSETRDFPDHHPFKESELQSLSRDAKAWGMQLLTTEKDWVRLPDAFRAQVAVLPVELVFDEPEAVRKLVG
jgi:tetraacyldisaccharide 4'-kinase